MNIKQYHGITVYLQFLLLNMKNMSDFIYLSRNKHEQFSSLNVLDF